MFPRISRAALFCFQLSFEPLMDVSFRKTNNDPKTDRNWPIPRCTLIYLHGCSCNAAQYLEDGWELPWTGKDMWWDMVGRGGTMGPCQVCGSLVATGFPVGYVLMWLSWLVIVGDASCTNCIVLRNLPLKIALKQDSGIMWHPWQPLMVRCLRNQRTCS
jgi:hypothetical protein